MKLLYTIGVLILIAGCDSTKFRNIPSCSPNDEFLGNSMYPGGIGITSQFDKEQGRKICEALRQKTTAKERTM